MGNTRSELQHQPEKLELALEASQMAIWEWDLSTESLSTFIRGAQLFGFSSSNFPSTKAALFDRIPSQDREKLIAEGKKAVHQKRPLDIEFRVNLPGGQVRWLHGRGRCISNEAGKPVKLSGTLCDITDRKLAEIALDRARQVAEDASALKSAFLANMSHEIRTPLGVIMGFSELLSEPGLDPLERNECVEVIHRNGEHLTRLIDDILDLSKVEAGKLEIDPVPVYVHAELEHVFLNLRAKALARGVGLTIHYDDDAPNVIETDQTRFRQIVTNLVGNAIKFTEAGEVRVSVSRVEKSGIDSLSIHVQDSGVGISKEGCEHLFEPFERGDTVVNKRFAGTGLGLALSRKIARLLGGEILLLSSTPGMGSLFEFTVPAGLSRQSVQKDSRGKAAIDLQFHEEGGPERPLEGIRILLAEDTPDNQELMKRLLGRRGADVAIVDDGEEAVDAAMAGDFDVVLMDIQMPKLDGYEATKRLRMRGYRKPIIALTAHAMKGERQRCLDLGFEDHLAKPVQPEVLTEAILKFAAPTHAIAAAL